MRIRRELFLAPLFLLSAIFATACSESLAANSAAAASSQAISAEVAKGAWLYVDYACIQCHGLGGRGGSLLHASGPSLISVDFKKAFPRDPKFDAALVSMIRNGSIIEDGRAASMPAWNGILSDEDMQNIVAYIRAGLPDMGVPVPQTRTGEEIYKSFACVKCHGEIGTGGIRNAAAVTSEHKIIPALGGQDFRKQLSSVEKLRKIILNGKLVEHGRPGVVYMPAWGKIGTADQIEKVIQYIWDFAGSSN